MIEEGGIRVAVVGLGFGAEFVPIYKDHPDVSAVSICDAHPERLRKCAGRIPVRHSFESLDEMETAVYTRQFVYGEDENHLSFGQGGGHHGSHPHLVHEFVRSIVERRPPAIDAVTAAHWTAVGICAHESALVGGIEVTVPRFGQ